MPDAATASRGRTREPTMGWRERALGERPIPPVGGRTHNPCDALATVGRHMFSWVVKASVTTRGKRGVEARLSSTQGILYDLL